MGDKFNFHGTTQFINKPKDNVSITQNNYAESGEIEKHLESVTDKFEEKLNEIVSKQNETKTDYENAIADLKTQIQNMLNETLSVIGIGLEFLDSEEQRRFEELKYKPDWENTITFVIPLLDKIGIKIETKTNLENLPEKFRDQIEIAKAKGKELFGSDFQTNELDENRTKGELTE